MIRRIVSLMLVVAISVPAVPAQAMDSFITEADGSETAEEGGFEIAEADEFEPAEADELRSVNYGDSLVPELTVSTLGDQLLVNYMGEVSPVRIIAGAYEGSGRAAGIETVLLERNKQARFSDLTGFRSDPDKLKTAGGKLTEAANAYEKLMRAERFGASQNEQLHWAQELTKTYESQLGESGVSKGRFTGLI